MSDWRGDAWEPPSAPDCGLGGSHGFPDDFSAPEAATVPEKGSAARADWDRKNAIVFHAWQEFSDRLSDYQADHFSRTGRDLIPEQITDHKHRFARIMRRAYGVAFADPRWVEDHNAWHERR